MKALVGIDVQSIEEVENSLNRFGSRYRRLLYTEGELDSCGDNLATASELAARFAVKEAVLKVLVSGTTTPPWRSIEVSRVTGGRPEIVLHDLAADLARNRGISEFSVSFSHAGGIATAAVVATVHTHPEQPDS